MLWDCLGGLQKPSRKLDKSNKKSHQQQGGTSPLTPEV